MVSIVDYDTWKKDLAYQHADKGVVTSADTGKYDQEHYDNYVKTMQNATPEQQVWINMQHGFDTRKQPTSAPSPTSGGKASYSTEYAQGPAPSIDIPAPYPVLNNQQYQSQVNEFKSWLRDILNKPTPDIQLPNGVTQEDLLKWLNADPEPFRMTPEMTSQYQLNKMLMSGSPLMQQANYMGRASAAQRGLLNTSMSGRAAQDAMIMAATPFAQQDSQAYFRAAEITKAAEDQKLMQMANFAMNMMMQDQAFKQNWEALKFELEGRSLLAEQAYGYGMAQQEQQGNITSHLQRQGYTEQANLANQSFQYQWELAKQGFEFNMAYLQETIAAKLEEIYWKEYWELIFDPEVPPPVKPGFDPNNPSNSDPSNSDPSKDIVMFNNADRNTQTQNWANEKSAFNASSPSLVQNQISNRVGIQNFAPTPSVGYAQLYQSNFQSPTTSYFSTV